MDMMIQSGRLFEFVREIINIRNEEVKEESAWEVWLHKVFNQDWPEYLASLNDTSSTNAAPTHEELQKTVSESAAKAPTHSISDEKSVKNLFIMSAMIKQNTNIKILVYFF